MRNGKNWPMLQNGMEHVGDQIAWDYLEEISGGDYEFEQDLIRTFVDSAPALLNTYADAVLNEEFVAARHAAHTLKGSSRSIGAFMFADVCELAERSARDEDLDTCRNLQPQIASAYHALASGAHEFLKQAA